MVVFVDEDSLRKALERNPGCSSLVSLPAATKTEGLRGPITTGEGLVSGFWASGKGCVLLKGFVNSILGLDWGEAPFVWLLVSVGGFRFVAGATVEDEPNLELKLEIHELLLPSFLFAAAVGRRFFLVSSVLGPLITEGLEACDDEAPTALAAAACKASPFSRGV